MQFDSVLVAMLLAAIYDGPLCCALLLLSFATHNSKCLGLAKTIYIQCIHGNFGREITKYTVIYCVYIRFWPTLQMLHQNKTQWHAFADIFSQHPAQAFSRSMPSHTFSCSIQHSGICGHIRLQALQAKMSSFIITLLTQVLPLLFQALLAKEAAYTFTLLTQCLPLLLQALLAKEAALLLIFFT